MNHFQRKPGFVSLLLIVSLCSAVVSAPGQKRQKPSEQQKQQAEAIELRTGNGIFVDTPKVYDDSSLQLMLNNARTRLATIQAIDQTGLLSRIGALTGASLTQSSLGVTVTGPPIPQSVVTANQPTGQTTLSTAGGGSTQTVTNLPVQGEVTTNPQQNVSIPTAPAGGVTLPTSYSVSASDALNEQMQLTYEIANLQLLLEGSLNDRYVKGTRFIKPRTTLGFPITISSLAPYKNAVAVVEVEVTNAELNLDPKDRPAVTALLPREKTYNVAALTDRMTSIGGGLVTQVINGGFSFFKGRKSYYIVQDQDTLAGLQNPSVRNATAFSWQFRPVLGQSFVKPGLKQTFVQLAAPLRADGDCFGKMKVRTYWRRIDRKTGVLKEVIPESIQDVGAVDPEIPVYDLTPIVKGVSYDDLGGGIIRINVVGNFLGGTYIRVGNNHYREGSPGFFSELTRIQFVTSASDVAKHKAYIVSRDGSETEIIYLIGASVNPTRARSCLALPNNVEGFRLTARIPEVTVTAGSLARFHVTITASSGLLLPINLSATAYPMPTGPSTAWSTGAVAPAPGTSVNARFVVDTLAATPPGTYSIQLRADTGPGSPYAAQAINVLMHLAAPVTKPNLTVAITAFDDSKSIIKATISNRPPGPDLTDYMIVINDRVFGLRDAPVERNAAGTEFRAVVPTSLVSGPTTVQVKPLFWDEAFATAPSLLATNLETVVDRVVVLDRSGDPIRFLLYGSRLSANAIAFPAGITLSPLGGNDPTTIGTFTIAKAQWASLKQIVLQKAANERPVFVTMPTQEPPPKITLTVGGRVVVGTDEVTVTGDTFDNLKSVVFNKTPINRVVDGKSVKLIGLVAARVTSVAGEPELEFEFNDGKKNTLKLDVVSSKIETVARP